MFVYLLWVGTLFKHRTFWFCLHYLFADCLLQKQYWARSRHYNMGVWQQQYGGTRAAIWGIYSNASLEVLTWSCAESSASHLGEDKWCRSVGTVGCKAPVVLMLAVIYIKGTWCKLRQSGMSGFGRTDNDLSVSTHSAHIQSADGKLFQFHCSGVLVMRSFQLLAT